MNKNLLGAFYDYTKIPLWYFQKDKPVVSCIDHILSKHEERLKEHISSIHEQILQKHTNKKLPFFYPHSQELYISIYVEDGTVLAGPLLLINPVSSQDNLAFSFAPLFNDEVRRILVENLPRADYNSLNSYIRLLMLSLNNNAPSLEEIRTLHFGNISKIDEEQLVTKLFENAEEESFHTPYAYEVALLSCVKDGDIKRLSDTYSSLPATKYGKMSQNPLKQMLYGSIANVTLVTRYAIEGGLNEEEAFTLSDMYINRFENCNDLFELNSINEQMAMDFTERVSRSHSTEDVGYSLAVRSCIRYIYSHNHSNISLDELSDEIGLSAKYISSIFKKEVGVGISTFVENKKIEEAKNLLKYSPYSYGEISEYLSFASQSYFIKIFRKHTGLTPRQFRESNIAN